MDNKDATKNIQNADSKKQGTEQEGKKDKSEKPKTGLKLGGAAAGKTGTYASLGVKLTNAAAMFASMLFQLGGLAVTTATSLAATFFGTFMGIVTTVGSAIASAIGLTATTVTTIVTGIATILTVVGTIVVGVMGLFNPEPYVDDRPIDCRDKVIATSLDGDISVEDAVRENAQLVHSVLHYYGLSDEQIAGVLGNWYVESQIDPTSVEIIYNERHHIGERKADALSNFHAFTVNEVFPLYARNGISLNKKGYLTSDGHTYYAGVGLGGFTGVHAERIFSVADSAGYDWHDMSFQMAYVLSSHYRPGFFAKWAKHPSSTPQDAATYFAKHWEGNTSLGQEERRRWALTWFKQIKTWVPDEAVANSVFSLASEIGSAALTGVAQKALDDCVKMQVYDNANIAGAAVSYAHPKQALGVKNNGTLLYRKVHDNIFKTDNTYMSCDRGVSTAVRWSGHDDDYPIGPSAVQLGYLRTSPKWDFVGTADDLSIDDLLPGDVFVVAGHTFLYVGEDMIRKLHGDKAYSDSNTVSASFGDFSPVCNRDTTFVLSRGGYDEKGRGPYYVYRCTDPDYSSQYKSAGAGIK